MWLLTSNRQAFSTLFQDFNLFQKAEEFISTLTVKEAGEEETESS